MSSPWGLGKVSRKGMPPSTFGCSMVNFMWGSMEFKYCSILSWLPLGMILKTSSTYLFQSLTGMGSSGPRAIFSKYSIYMLATTGEHREPIVVPYSCLKNLSWKVKTQFSKTNFTEYIAVTKRICDELGENTAGKDCTEIYQKTKEVLQHFKDKKGPTCNITKQEKEAIKTLREDSSWVVLTADKGVAMVVMDKSQYIEKCMALLNDTKVYKPCMDTTKKLHRDIQESLRKLNREHGSSRLHDWSKIHYNWLLPTGETLPLHLGFMVYLKYTKLTVPCTL